jgi:hypothetical protein
LHFLEVFLSESGCKGKAFFLNLQIFSQNIFQPPAPLFPQGSESRTVTPKNFFSSFFLQMTEMLLNRPKTAKMPF